MTALDGKVRATGLLAYKAVLDHAIEHGLPAPESLELDDRFVRVWIIAPTDAAQWVESIHIVTTTIDHVTPGRERVHTVGTLPGLLGQVKVELRWSRPAMHVVQPLRQVGA